MRDVLFILGMHRSGTSVLARAAGELGFALPRDRGGPAPDNIHGHFEPAAVVAANEAILAAQGSGWARIAPVSGAAETTPAVLASALSASFGRSRRIVVKDPRLSLALPFWRAAVNDRVSATGRAPAMRALIALRDPRAVVRSLAARDGTDRDLALMLWLGHTLGALDATEGMTRALMLFPAWLGPDHAHLSGALGRIGIVPDARRIARIMALGDPALVSASRGESHGAAAPDDEMPAPLLALAGDTFAALSAAALGGVMPPEALRADLARRLDVICAPARAAELAAAARHVAFRADAEGVAGRLRTALAATEGQRDAAMAELGAAEAQRDAAMAGLGAAREGLAVRDAALRAAEAQRDAAMAGLGAAREGLAVRDAALRAAEARASRLRAAGQAQAAAIADKARSEFAALSSERDAAEAARDEALTQQDALRAALLQADGQIGTLAARLRAEERAVMRPIYRNLWQFGGQTLRRGLPDRTVERIKARLPAPDRPAVATARGAMLTQPGPTPCTAPEIASRDPGQGCADIFILSIIAWDFRTQRPQHLARQMARRGHRVFYIEMETDMRGPDCRRIEPGLHVVRLGARLTGLVPAYTGLPTPPAARRWVEAFQDFAARIGASPLRHLVVQHPYWWPFVRHLPAENRLTFDCMDEISGFSNTLPHVLEAEEALIAAADRMIVTSDYLAVKHGARRPVTLVRNAADVAHFDAPVPGETAARWTRAIGASAAAGTGRRLRIGYVGAIAEWFDSDLVSAVARAMPEAEFHFCGAVTTPEAQALGRLANLTLHGEIAYADVPAFVAAMDVMVIPFRLTPIIRACDPVKFYEYAAAGRPVVTTPLPELARAGDLAFRADTAEGFCDAIRRAAAAGLDARYRERLVDYARANTWADRGRDFMAAMLAAPKVSVVVLSYGDPALTLATLHSLTDAGGTYPGLEIIVADNGSSGESLARLREAAAAAEAEPGRCAVRLIENGANLGFARGNNAGIAAATGEYVLLLNNDTYVAPGAIAAMVAHLEADPGVGVVGPLTNAIGNEARVEVAYADMAGMAAEMRRVTAGHRGQRSEVAVCAYFCAMFRRADLAAFGPLCEDYGLGMFEDDDHCARIRAAGYRCVIAEDAFVHHHLSASFDAMGAGSKAELFRRNRAIYEERWGPWTPHRYRDSRPAPTLKAA